MHTIPFTKQGYGELSRKLKNLELKRTEAVKTLARAREMGDLSENGLYKAAKFELSSIDREIRNLKYLIKNAKVSKPTTKDVVQIGHKVTVKNSAEQKIFFIVGEYEANPNENKISNKSPIGFALMGRKVKEEIEINTPNKIINYIIVSID